MDSLKRQVTSLAAFLRHTIPLSVLGLVLVADFALDALGIFQEPPPSPPSGTAECNYQELADQASSKLVEDQHQEALALFEEALVCIRQTPDPDPLRIATAHDDIARVHQSIAPTLDDPKPAYLEALGHRQQSLELSIGVWGRDDLRIAPVLDRLADVYSHLGDHDQALTHYDRSCTMRRASLAPEHSAVIACLGNLIETLLLRGDQHLQREEYDQAVLDYQRALEYQQEASGSEHLETTPILDKVASTYSEMEKYTEALSAAEKVLDIREKSLPPDHPNVVTSRRNVALLHGKIADSHFARGEYGPAGQHFDRAVETLEGVPVSDPGLLAAALTNSGVLYKHLGNYPQASLRFQGALDTLKMALGDQHPDTVTPRRHLADMDFKLGNYDSALALFQEVCDILRVNPELDSLDLAICLSDLGAVHLRAQEYGQALPLLLDALAAAKRSQGSEDPAIVPFLNNLAVLRRSMGDTKEALSLYNEALIIRRAQPTPDLTGLATSLNNLGALYVSEELYDEALPLLEEALDLRVHTLGRGHPDTAVSLSNLGVLYGKQGQHDTALEKFSEALENQDRSFRNLSSVVSEEQKLLFLQANQTAYHLTLSLIRRHFIGDEDAVRLGMRLALSRKGAVLDSQLDAEALLREKLGNPDIRNIWDRLIENRSKLARLLIDGPGGGGVDVFVQQVEDLTESVDEDELRLSRELSDVSPVLFNQQVTPEMVAASLPPDSALVEFVQVEEWVGAGTAPVKSESYIAFVLTSDNRVALVDLGDAPTIDARINNARKMIESPINFEDLIAQYNEINGALSDLYVRLIAPLDLPLEESTRIILSPDGELNKVPFAALRTPEESYLVQTHALSYVTSGSDLLRKHDSPGPGPDLVLAADLDYGSATNEEIPGETGREARRDFERLLFTPLELEQVPPLVPGDKQVILSGASGTESAVRAEERPTVLHLATHGFFLRDPESILPRDPTSITGLLSQGQYRGVGGVKEIPLPTISPDLLKRGRSSLVRSGLALSGANRRGQNAGDDDGLLTALEVTGMDFRGTQLVVLSACQTAEGDWLSGEGVFGLRRAFVLAGAKNLVMSQWRVSDKFTPQQMEWFYREAFGQHDLAQGTADLTMSAGPRGFDIALQQAQKKSIDHLQGTFLSGVAPVQLWAPFIVQVSGS